MKEKESWKNRLKWDFLVIGVFVLISGVVMFRRMGDQQDVSVDISAPTVESIDFDASLDVPLAPVDGTIAATTENRGGENANVTPINSDFDFTGTNLIKKPDNIEDAIEFDRWVNSLLRNQYENSFFHNLKKANLGNVSQLLEGISEIRKSDGAIYYFFLGYIHCQLMLRNNSVPGLRDANYVKAIENYDRAIQNYDRAIQLNGNIAVFFHYRGMVDFYRAEFSGNAVYFSSAMPYFYRAGSLAPNWIEPLTFQGRCAFDLAKFRDSVTLLERVAQMDANRWKATSLLPRARAKVEMAAEFLDDNTPLDVAGHVATRRIKKPNTTDSRKLDRWNDVFRGIVKSVGECHPGRVPEFVTLLTGLTREDGKFYHYACGYIHDSLSRRFQDYRLTNYTQAVEQYTRAIELDDNAAIFYHFRGQVNYFYALNENKPQCYVKAIENYTAAQLRDPTWPMPSDMQGWAYLRLKKYDEAVLWFERALAIDPDCYDAMAGIVRVMSEKSERDPKNIELLRQGLDWVERWHKTIVKRKDRDELENGTGDAFGFIARWKGQEEISPVDHPECFTQNELMHLADSLASSNPKGASLIRERLKAGEVSPYFFYEFQRHPDHQNSGK